MAQSLSALLFIINALEPIMIHAPHGNGYCNDAVHDWKSGLYGYHTVALCVFLIT